MRSKLDAARRRIFYSPRVHILGLTTDSSHALLCHQFPFFLEKNIRSIASYITKCKVHSTQLERDRSNSFYAFLVYLCTTAWKRCSNKQINFTYSKNNVPQNDFTHKGKIKLNLLTIFPKCEVKVQVECNNLEQSTIEPKRRDAPIEFAK